MLPVGIVGLIAGANAIGDDLGKIVGDIDLKISWSPEFSLGGC
jgi:hypothetical protein